jgi:hypothetical protein
VIHSLHRKLLVDNKANILDMISFRNGKFFWLYLAIYLAITTSTSTRRQMKEAVNRKLDSLPEISRKMITHLSHQGVPNNVISEKFHKSIGGSRELTSNVVNEVTRRSKTPSKPNKKSSPNTSNRSKSSKLKSKKSK